MTSEKSSSKPPKLDDVWQEGDFEIITSDNVRFRISSAYLENWS